MDTRSTQQMEGICRPRQHDSRRNIFRNMKTCAISIQFCWSHLRRIESSDINIHAIVERTTQVITEVIKQVCNGGHHTNRYLELRNVHIALLQFLEDITWRFSKSTNPTELLHCRRFLNNCRLSRANRQRATLTTQDLDQVLTCSVKMVQ